MKNRKCQDGGVGHGDDDDDDDDDKEEEANMLEKCNLDMPEK